MTDASRGGQGYALGRRDGRDCERIARHWCPTLVSGEFLDGREHQFPGDTWPHFVRRLRAAALQSDRAHQTAPPRALYPATFHRSPGRRTRAAA